MCTSSGHYNEYTAHSQKKGGSAKHKIGVHGTWKGWQTDGEMKKKSSVFAEKRRGIP
jgi:hypothetical protein